MLDLQLNNKTSQPTNHLSIFWYAPHQPSEPIVIVSLYPIIPVEMLWLTSSYVSLRYLVWHLFTFPSFMKSISSHNCHHWRLPPVWFLRKCFIRLPLSFPVHPVSNPHRTLLIRNWLSQTLSFPFYSKCMQHFHGRLAYSILYIRLHIHAAPSPSISHSLLVHSSTSIPIFLCETSAIW